MFYKIVCEEVKDTQCIFAMIKDDVKSIYKDGLFYIQTSMTKSDIISKIKESLESETQFIVLPINDNNLSQQLEIVQIKVHEERKAEELKRFEEEQQEALKAANDFIEDIQKSLDKQLQDKRKGGRNSAKLRNKKQETTVEAPRTEPI